MDPNLYAAVSEGNIDGIMGLRHKINQVTRNHETILHLAVLSNILTCVCAILEEFPTLLDKLNSRNETALHLAASKGYKDVAEVLLNKANGLDSNEIISRPGIDFIRKGNVDLDTALHLAVRNHHEAVVKLIVLSDPSDEHSQNLKFETPLYLAAIGGYNDIVETILGTCINASVDGPEGRTALHAAVQSRNKNTVSAIMELRPDLYKRAENSGCTVFHFAAYLNCVTELDHLINFRSRDPDAMDAVMAMTTTPEKKTAHHVAAFQGNIYVLTQLMGYFPDVCGAVDENGWNILHTAAKQNQKELIQSILQDFPNVVANLLLMKDNDGNMPLHLLVVNGCFIPQLIEHLSIFRDTKNNYNFSPRDFLYFDEDIVGDQLMIKNGFKDSEVNYGRNFWHKVTNWEWLKSNNTLGRVPEIVVLESIRRRKDEKFELANKKIMKEEIEFYRGRTNTQIIVTALIATVTFTVGFTMPGGNHDGSGDADDGLAILSKQTAFNACMVADAIGLLFSISSLFLYFMSSLYQDPQEVSKFISASTGFNIVSVLATMLTFITGTYAVLSHSPGIAIIVSVISSTFFLLVVVLLIKWKYDPIEKFKV